MEFISKALSKPPVIHISSELGPTKPAFSQYAPHTLSCLLISVKVETLGITNDCDKFALANWIFEVCIVCTISLNAAIIHCRKAALQLRTMARRAFSS